MPRRHEREYVLAALKAGKHVLLKDPLSTSLHEFTEQLEFAKRYQKFIQFSTMFVHQYRVGRFMDRVIREQRFGRIHTINANLQLSYDDLDKVGKKFPLEGPGDGCIRVLGRFCVLVSVLIFSRIGSTVTSAQVLSTELGSLGECVAAKCVVHFTEVGSL